MDRASMEKVTSAASGMERVQTSASSNGMQRVQTSASSGSAVLHRDFAMKASKMTPRRDDETIEIWHQLDDGEKIYTKTWTVDGPPKARIVWVHGFSDHCNTCNPFFPLLASKGIEVFGFDQRGWGKSVKSKKQRGLSGGTKQYLDDINSVLRRFLPSFPQHSASRPDDVPLFLMGHSMGGAGVITHASRYPSSDIRGYLSASPWIKLPPETQPGKLTVVVGQFAAKYMPHFQIKQTVNLHLLSHDPQVVAEANRDGLCHDHFTLEGANDCLNRAAAIDAGEVIVSSQAGVKSFWLGHGTADKITAYDASKKWFENCCKVDDKVMMTYEGWYHKIHDEGPYKLKEQFAHDVATWILARTN